jgi:hypothetical protein
MNQSPDTIVLIHDPGVTPLRWDGWIDRYTKQGFWVIAPARPGLDRPIEEIVDYYRAIIEELDRPPIIMGHASGGTLTEILLDRGFGAAGVSIGGAASPAKVERRRRDRAPLLLIGGSVAQDGWEEVVDSALAWAVRNARMGAPA